MSVRVGSKADYEARLMEAREKLVVIDFHASWCDPCQRMAPHYETLALHHPDVLFLRVDVEECEAAAQQFAVKCVPTYVFVRDGQRIESFSGANEAQLRDLVTRLK